MGRVTPAWSETKWPTVKGRLGANTFQIVRKALFQTVVWPTFRNFHRLSFGDAALEMVRRSPNSSIMAGALAMNKTDVKGVKVSKNQFMVDFISAKRMSSSRSGPQRKLSKIKNVSCKGVVLESSM